MASKRAFKEIAVVLCLFAVSAILLALYSVQATGSKHLDSVFIFEGLDSLRTKGTPDSQTVNAAPVILKLWNAPPELYCELPLTSPEEPYHIFDNHAYLAMYPLALATWFLSSETVMAIMNTLTHLVVLFLPYFYLRWRTVPVLLSVVFVACVAIYAAWSWSFAGNYYMDRLYMLFMAPLLFGMHATLITGKVSRAKIVVGAICVVGAAACTERGAIMVAGLLCFYLLFCRKELAGKKVLPLMAAAVPLLLAYVAVYLAVFYKASGGGGGIIENRIHGWDMLWDRLTSPGGRLLIAINLLPLGLMVLASGYRYILLVFFAVLPNFLIRVGGAELNGWDTHYHVLYVPFILFAACIGYERIMKALAARPAAGAGVAVGFAAIALGIAAFVNPASGFDRSPRFAGIEYGIFGRAWSYYFATPASYERSTVDAFSKLGEVIPPGAPVSAMEAAMPSLYQGRRVHYFPLGMDKAEYLVIAGAVDNGKFTGVEGWVTTLDEKNDALIKACLSKRIEALGFRVVKEIPEVRYVIMQKK